MATPSSVLQQFWGFSSFRSAQADIVDAALQGEGPLQRRDQLVVLATGGGKSVCFQVPPLVLGKPAVVISPLISLMEDQVLGLTARGIRACFLGSAQTSAAVTADAWAGRYQFIYLTPELAVSAVVRLQQLHASHGLALVAVDEAHCVAEWGHDFRPEASSARGLPYRRLRELRQALQGVPFMALTATATPQVREDIVANLGLRDALKWVMTFERPNLHFSVRRKSGGRDAAALQRNFSELIEEAQKGQLQPTIIYTLTRNEAADVAVALNAAQGLQMRVRHYSAEMSVGERKAVHQAFLRDDVSVVVATLAFGMGIDKRRGAARGFLCRRAARICIAICKRRGRLGNVRRVYHWGCPASLEAYYQQAGRAGRDGVPSRCTLLWTPGDMSTNAFIKNAGHVRSSQAVSQQDRGASAIFSYVSGSGCRHREMVEYFDPDSFAPGPAGRCTGGCDNCDSQIASRAAAEEQDLSAEARLLLATVGRLREMGLGTAIGMLRGSRSTRMKPWMLDITAADGAKLHGAGAERSEDWWKALAGILTGRGLVAVQTRSQPGTRPYQVMVLTDDGLALLHGPPRPLMVRLSADMLAADRRRQQQQEAAAAAAAAAAAMDSVRLEEQRLFNTLGNLRKQLADAAGVAPTQLLSDFALWEVARKRPATPAQLAQCQGSTTRFVEMHGAALTAAVVAFCASSQLLHAGCAPSPAGGAAAGWLPRRSSASAGAAAVGAAGAACSQAAVCLSEPKGAAQEAHARYMGQGQSVHAIATTGRKSAINPQTVVGYLADAANAGLPMDWPRLMGEAGLPEEEARAISQAILAHGHEGLGAVRRALPQEAGYGSIKLVAALMNLGQGWFAASGAAALGQAAHGGAAGATAGDSGQGSAQGLQQQQQQAGGGGPPDAKRPRLSAPAGQGEMGAAGQLAALEAADSTPLPLQPVQPAEAPPPSRAAVAAWLASAGRASGLQLAARFCSSGNPSARQALEALLSEMCSDYELVRRGGCSATSSRIDLEDGAVEFLLL
eukprot:scaffold7.g3535.t1